MTLYDHENYEQHIKDSDFIDEIKGTPVSVAERAKVRVFGRSLAGIAGSKPAEGMDVCLVSVCVVR